MPSQEEVTEKLKAILVPGVMRSLVDMNLIRDITVANGKVDVILTSTALSAGAQEWLQEKVINDVNDIDGVAEVSVSFEDGIPKELNEINNTIAVMSGKGGVGKSLVASLTAVIMRRQGYEVGILDADITGPSIPKMFGISTRPSGNDKGIMPVSSKSGIEVMSINLLLPGEDDAVIWRGPLIGKAITQFWEEVLWGKLDYLIVDLPPGTADAPLTVMQTLPVSGVLIVFTPQDLTTMIVRKAVKMAQQMGKSVLGVIENMSYLYLPELGREIEIFGKSRGQEMAQVTGAPLLGRIPIDPELARLCDEGNIELYNTEALTKLGDSLSRIADKL